MEIINYSEEPVNKLMGWLPSGLHAEKIIFFPDACPGKPSLPTGTVIFTRQEDWRRFAVSDCGCGMLLARSDCRKEDFKKTDWDKIYFDLKSNKGKKGDLGSGNHFLNALHSDDDDCIYFLIHTGSRNESASLGKLITQPSRFDLAYWKVCDWAGKNRLSVSQICARYFGDLEIIVDRNHNNYELFDNGAILRKGAVRIEPGQITVIPSSIEGEVVLVRATEKVTETLLSLNHGTGRIMSRSDAKIHADDYDYESLRRRIYIPEMINDSSIKTEAPFCYRDLDTCLKLIRELIVIEKRFRTFAYLGQI